MRADEALVLSGICESVERARALIMEGRALYGSDRIAYPSQTIKRPELLRLKGAKGEYVSRGAYKLKKAFEVFPISAEGKVCADIGSSTGGFTDIMLRYGASKVYCVDVGYNLLDWKIRSDPRVVPMEKTNARLLRPEMFAERIQFGATDVSFISLKLVLPAVFGVLEKDADFVALIKPQFEISRELVGEKGVVRDREAHISVIEDLLSFLTQSGISVRDLSFSPIRGPEGNIEFLTLLKNDACGDSVSREKILETVEKAHAALEAGA
ncbi:MAG: TlyA family RNA methyltransferase [Clostridia bacterium]|nr:TlyA family RNA methyltransferase [Clostridia bacterium]